MMRPILVTILCLVAGAQSETGVCRREDQSEIWNCVRESHSSRGTCAGIETAIRCIKSTNEHCATDAYLVGELTLEFGPMEVLSDEPCFHQRFEEYFNQDGLCSFQDAKDLIKCFNQHDDKRDRDICKTVSLIGMCIKEVRESCNGFVQRELKIAQDQLVDQGETIPQCLKSMIAGEEEEKFPVFNKFVDDFKKLDLTKLDFKKLEDELALIKELINNQ